MGRWILALGAFQGLLAVAAAAAAAHLAAGRLDAVRMRTVDAAVQMQGWHALAIVACGVWVAQGGGALASWAGAAFFLGSLMFCGAAWSLGAGGFSLGPVAPAGGLTLMLGWLLLAVSALRAG